MAKKNINILTVCGYGVALLSGFGEEECLEEIKKVATEILAKK